MQSLVTLCRFFLVYIVDADTKASTCNKVLAVLDIKVTSSILSIWFDQVKACA